MPSRTIFIFVAALLLAFILQCAWAAYSESITFDESIHASVGLESWREGHLYRWIETPPLGRLLLTLPIVSRRFQMDVVDPDGWLLVTGIRPGPRAFIAGPRAVNIALGVLLGILLWSASRRLFGDEAALFALALYAFSPPLLAHFSIATVDGIATLAVFAVAVEWLRWREHPSLRETALMGLIGGLALSAKLYTPPYVALALVLMLLTKDSKFSEEGESPRFTLSPRRWSWKPAFTAFAVACVVLWATYFFHVGALRFHNGQLNVTYAGHPLSMPTSTPWAPDFTVPVPAPEFFAAFQEAAFHNRVGHPAFLLGKVYRNGVPRWFVPAAIILKWPTVVLLLGLAGVLAAIFAATPLAPRTDLFVFGSAGVLAVLLGMSARLGIGDRHVLPAYPMLLIFAAAFWRWATGLASRRRIAGAALIALALLNAADALRFAPGYLAYFNIFVAPDRSYRLLTDSSLDWGQGLLQLREYQQQNPGEPIHLAYFGSVDPGVYGIKSMPLLPEQRVTGTVVVSATLLSGQYLQNPAAYRWLLEYPPKAVFDHSLFVFEVPGN